MINLIMLNIKKVVFIYMFCFYILVSYSQSSNSFKGRYFCEISIQDSIELYNSCSSIQIDGCTSLFYPCKNKTNLSFFKNVQWDKLSNIVGKISVNNVLYFPEKLPIHRHVDDLSLGYVDSVSIEGICNTFPNLKYLHILNSYNLLEFDNAVKFDSLESLVIDFSELLIANEFAEKSNIKELIIRTLSRNFKESNLLAISKLKSIEYLVISDKLTSGLPNEFKNLAHLENGSFYVDKNVSRSNFFQTLFSIPSLKLLKIKADGVINNINQIKIKNDLEWLCLEQCIKEVPNWLNNLDSLKFLSLKGNSLSSIEFDFNQCENLISLDISKNKLKQIPSKIYNLKRLKILNVSNNKISEISDDIEKMESLEIIDISNTKIKQISQKIKSLPKLKKIRISKFDNKKTINDLRELLPNCVFEYTNGGNYDLLGG